MNFKNTIFLLIALIAGININYSQTNIVVNQGFELCSSCPTITGQYHLCNNWLNCNGNIGPGLWGTPDYYNTCGSFHATYNPVPPNTALGTINPQSGNALMGLVNYNAPYPNYREYLSNQLSCPMQPGETYTVSFWINNATNPKYRYNTSHFGVYFSTAMPNQVGYNVINVLPQFEITTVISNTVWTQYSFTINPTVVYNYITMGCFRADNAIQINNVTPSAQNPYSNWYLDNIEVIKPAPQPNVLVTNPACNQSNGSATVQLNASNATYTWLPSNQNTNSISNLAAGVYSVIVGDGCSVVTKTLSLVNSNSPTLSTNSHTMCSPGTNTLIANVVGGNAPYTFTWSSGGTNPTSIINVNNTSVYTCTVFDNNGCSSTASSTVYLNNVESNFNYSINVCKGKVYLNNTSLSASSYTWSFGDGAQSFSINPTHSYTLAGNYTITLVSSGGPNCIDSIKKIVNIDSVSLSAFSYHSASCDSLVEFYNNSIGAASFLWNFGDGNNSTLAGTLTHVYNNPGIYTVSLVSNPGGNCPDTNVQIVSINYNSIADFSVSLNQCSRLVSLVNLSSNSSDFYWDLGDGFTSTITSLSHNYANNSINNYTVILIVNKGTSCADTMVKAINISEQAVAYFNFKVNPCNGLINFTNLSQNATDYYWYLGNSNVSTLKDPISVYDKPGVYPVMLIAYKDALCPDTLMRMINVNLSTIKANFDYEYIDDTYDVKFLNKSANATSFFWDFNDGYTSNSENPLHTFENPQKIRVCQVVKNSQLCGDTLCKDILIKPNWTFYLPNTFTPNDDGINDEFFPKATNIISCNIEIFDRWGEKIFVSNDFYKRWDGTFKGEFVKDDIYVWKAKVVDLFSKSHILTGHVMVIK
ncbi:MAG: PKD domain-containing protein [Bacteroidia bacterium]